jgi:D-alanyl-D-alanine carboxypeptidase/D-alanyl-D-alanine-endopeptidase (penicillin-binding protein 4)
LAYLAVLEPDPRAEARLCDALGDQHEVALAHSWSGLERILAGEPLDGCIVDADWPGREEAVAEIRRIRQAHPGIAIVAHADVAQGDPELFRFGRIGVDGIVLAIPPGGYGNRGGIRHAVERALSFARAERVRSALQGRYGAFGADAVAWAVEHARGAPDVATFAAAMGRSRRTLRAALRADGLPAANRVLVWGRLLLAGAYLARDHRTVEETAYALGYSSANALGRAMKRETGHSPSEVASRGGMALVQSAIFPRRGVPRRRSRGWKTLVALLLAAVHTSCATSRAAPAAVPVSVSIPPMAIPTPRPTSAPTPGGPLRADIDRILDTPPFDQMHFGVLAVDAATGRTLYERNARRKFVPASNEKLLVTSAALALLGPDYRYRTALWSTGTPEDGVLDGNLVLVGTGDPTLSRPFWPSGEYALEALADSVLAAGIRHVTGSLVVDASAWDSTGVGPTWEAEDLGAAYAATGGAFAIDDGVLHVRALGAPTPVQAPTLTWSPTGTAGFVVSQVVTAPADSATRIRGAYLPESRRLVLEGRVRAGATDTTSVAIRDPVRQATAALYRILGERGVEVDGGWSVAWDPGASLGRGCVANEVSSCAAASQVAALTSPPLSDIVQAILAPSQNWMAEQLIRTLGAVRGTRGSWPEGIKVVKQFLQDDVGVDSLDVSVQDGSGLSASDLVTPRALVRILRYMEAQPYGERFREALAEPSEEGSTLEKRLPDLEGRLFAKTGTISNVNSLAGYLVGDDGREVVFSILSNGSGLPSARVRETIDDVVRALAGRRP